MRTACLYSLENDMALFLSRGTEASSIATLFSCITCSRRFDCLGRRILVPRTDDDVSTTIAANQGGDGGDGDERHSSGLGEEDKEQQEGEEEDHGLSLIHI